MCDQKSVYIHIPFCIKKCIYCDFYSQTDLSLIPVYSKALQKEIRKRSGVGEQVNTIYFGGGTPSLLPVKEVETLLQTVSDTFIVSRNVEVTFEVNPGTVDYPYLSQLRSAGINRLSIGVQSFNDDKLKFLNRIHTANQARCVIDDAQKAGFNNISIDLMYGVPFETESSWLKDLKEAVKMMLPHLSCYMLTIEPSTPLYEKLKNGVITPLGSRDMSSLFKKTSQFLSEYKYDHYEISSFSKTIQGQSNQNRSMHNSKYWDMTPYYGFGAAAHSYDGNTRSWNYQNIQAYIKDLYSGRLPIEEKESLFPEQKILEIIMLRLRTLEGLDLIRFKALFHTSFENQYKDILEQICKESLGFIKDDRFTLTLEGKARLDSIVEAFARKTL